VLDPDDAVLVLVGVSAFLLLAAIATGYLVWRLRRDRQRELAAGLTSSPKKPPKIPLKSSEVLICGKCGKPREDPHDSYCKQCRTCTTCGARKEAYQTEETVSSYTTERRWDLYCPKCGHQPGTEYCPHCKSYQRMGHWQNDYTGDIDAYCKRCQREV
jgi:hypothetical protein